MSGPTVESHVSFKMVFGLSTASSSSSSSVTPTSLSQESQVSTPIPTSVDSERADEREQGNPVQVRGPRAGTGNPILFGNT